MFADEIDLSYLGPLNVEHWSLGMSGRWSFGSRQRSPLLRPRLPRGPARPDQRGTRLYDWLGEPVTDDSRPGMRRWWAANAENARQNVHPRAAEFGLDLDAVRPLFADYVARAAAWTSERSS